MVSLATAPVTALKKSWTGANQRFVTAYGGQKVYAHLEIDKLGRINFIIKLNDLERKNTMYLHVAKAHLFEMLMYHLTLKPIYPYYSDKNPSKNHVWTYNNDLKDEGVHQYDNVDLMTADEIRDYYTRACEHMKGYVSECSPAALEMAQKQFDALLLRQTKIDILYESEKALNTFKI